MIGKAVFQLALSHFCQAAFGVYLFLNNSCTGGGRKQKKHITFLINTYFLPGPYDPLLIPIKMLFFFFAPSADRISDQPGYATNLPAQLNPTDSERSKGLMHSLKFSTAQAGALMQDLPLHCN